MSYYIIYQNKKLDSTINNPSVEEQRNFNIRLGDLQIQKYELDDLIAQAKDNIIAPDTSNNVKPVNYYVDQFCESLKTKDVEKLRECFAFVYESADKIVNSNWDTLFASYYTPKGTFNDFNDYVTVASTYKETYTRNIPLTKKIVTAYTDVNIYSIAFKTVTIDNYSYKIRSAGNYGCAILNFNYKYKENPYKTNLSINLFLYDGIWKIFTDESIVTNNSRSVLINIVKSFSSLN